LLVLLVAGVLRVARSGCGWGSAMIQLSGLLLSLAVPKGICDDHDRPRLNPVAPGSVLLSSRSTLAVSSLVTIIIAGPPVDLP
jgi:hypothetical protein